MKVFKALKFSVLFVGGYKLTIIGYSALEKAYIYNLIDNSEESYYK